MLDALILYRGERTRAAPSQGALDAFAVKTTSALDAIALPPAGRVDIGDITLAVALGYLDFRFPDVDWRAARPDLARWFAAFDARPSMIATTVVDG